MHPSSPSTSSPSPPSTSPSVTPPAPPPTPPPLSDVAPPHPATSPSARAAASSPPLASSAASGCNPPARRSRTCTSQSPAGPPSRTRYAPSASVPVWGADRARRARACWRTLRCRPPESTDFRWRRAGACACRDMRADANATPPPRAHSPSPALTEHPLCTRKRA